MTIGINLGHQLLADALGGTCGPQNPPEIGIMEIELTEAGRADPIFAHMPTTQKCLQWHSVRVAQAPDDAVVLATSPLCPNQAMRIGPNAWSMQYHVEIEPDTIDNWTQIPAYHNALINSVGESALSEMKQQSAANMPGFNRAAEQLYLNFRGAVGD